MEICGRYPPADEEGAPTRKSATARRRGRGAARDGAADRKDFKKTPASDYHNNGGSAPRRE